MDGLDEMLREALAELDAALDNLDRDIKAAAHRPDSTCYCVHVVFYSLLSTTARIR